jgi:hypothetical protein
MGRKDGAHMAPSDGGCGQGGVGRRGGGWVGWDWGGVGGGVRKVGGWSAAGGWVGGWRGGEAGGGWWWGGAGWRAGEGAVGSVRVSTWNMFYLEICFISDLFCTSNILYLKYC